MKECHNDEPIGNIGALLNATGIQFQTRPLRRSQAQRDLISALRNMFASSKEHGERYVVIIDRRHPSFDGRYELNNNLKDWSDRVFIYRAPTQISTQNCDILAEGFLHRTLESLIPGRIGAKNVLNGYMFAMSYHMYAQDKLKTYFHSNGCGQRLTQYEHKYYWPRLFMKVDGQFQDKISPELNEQSNTELEMFFTIEDTEHSLFKRSTMNLGMNRHQ